MPRILRRHRLEKMKQILHGALPEFLRHGYACTSMDKIASSAGVSKQTLYSHFHDKDGLFTALIEELACKKFQLIWSKPLEGEPETVLKELAHRLLKEVKEEEHLCFSRLIVAESKNRQDLAQLFIQKIVSPAIEKLKAYFEQHPELNIIDAEATARIFIGSLIHHVILQYMLHGQGIMPMQDEILVNNLVHLVTISAGKSNKTEVI